LSSIRVRLIDREKWPAHGPWLDGCVQTLAKERGAPKEVISWSQWRGYPILVGSPLRPTRRDGWTCGTDFVWPVLDEHILQVWGIPEYKGRFFVCRHQIEAGD
jgi:hypothetical protein